MENNKFERVVRLAKNFLDVADKLNEDVSAYLDGSNSPKAIEAYYIVREADKEFIDSLNELWDESYKYGLNYELAESVLGM